MTVLIQLNSDITDSDDQDDDEYDDDDDYFGSKMSKTCDVKRSVEQRLHCSKARGTKGDSDTKLWIYSVCVCTCVEGERKRLCESVTQASYLKQENLKYTCNRTIMIIRIKCHLSWCSLHDRVAPERAVMRLLATTLTVQILIECPSKQ